MIILAIGLIAYYYASVWSIGLRRVHDTVNYMITRQAFRLDLNQPRYLLDNSTKDDGVLYLAEISLYYFLTHGALERRAAFMKSVSGTPDEKGWIQDNRSLRFLSTLNPISIYSDNLCEGGVCVRSGDSLEIHFVKPRQLSSIQISLSGDSGKIRGSINFLDDQSKKIEIGNLFIKKGSSENWSYFEGDIDPLISGFQIKIAGGADMYEVHGIRLSQDALLYWPWNEGVSVTLYKSNKEPMSVEFATSQLYPGFDRSLKILMDSGSTVLAEIMPKS